MMNRQTDEELIRAAQQGCRTAAGSLAERCRSHVLGIALQALGNRDDASDVAQEALVYAMHRIQSLRDPGVLRAWLRQVTLSHCIDYRRRRATRRLGEPITLLSEVAEEGRCLESLFIRQTIAHLSESQRDALLLHYEGGWSLRETAALLQIPVNTVRSRLMAARSRLRRDLQPSFAQRRKMLTTRAQLTQSQAGIVERALPGAAILSVESDPEPWMPFTPRVHLRLADGSERAVDFRRDITPGQAQLLPVLERLGIPCPRLIAGPAPALHGGYYTLCEIPRGENLLLWALGGTPHRIRLATERAFEAIDRLQGASEALATDPIGSALPRRTLTDEIDIISGDTQWYADPWLAEAGRNRREWLSDPWFQGAIQKTLAAARDVRSPLVFTHHLHFYPNWLRIEPAQEGRFAEPLGWPGDARYRQNPLVEVVTPFGHFGDPLLGLAMVWIYDCYPFVHTGFVEQFLWRRGVSRREFAPRLAIKALEMIARDLPIERPEEGEHWDSLRGWAEQALSWL